MGEDRSTIGLRAQGALAIVLAGLVATCGGDRGDTPLGPLVVIGDGSTQGHQAKKDAGAPAEKRLHLRRVLGEPGLYDRDIVDFVQFSPDGSLLVLQSRHYGESWSRFEEPRPRWTWLLDGRTGAILHRWTDSNRGSVAWFPENHLLCIGSVTGSVALYDTKRRRPMKRLAGLGQAVTGIALSNDGKTLVAGADSGTSDGYIPSRIGIWDPESGRLLHRFVGDKWPITHVAIRPDGREFASASASVSIWKLEKGRATSVRKGIRSKTDWTIAALRYSPDGRFWEALYREVDPTLGRSRSAWWRVHPGTPKRLRPGRRFSVPRPCALPLPCSGASMGNPGCHVTSFGTPKERCYYEGNIPIKSLDYRGDRLVTAGWDEMLRVWHANPPRLRTKFRAGGPVTYEVGLGPGARKLVSVGSAVVLWSLGGAQPTRLSKSPPPIREPALSPDGHWMASIADGVVITDTGTGAYRHLRRNGFLGAFDVNWSANGSLVVLARSVGRAPMVYNVSNLDGRELKVRSRAFLRTPKMKRRDAHFRSGKIFGTGYRLGLVAGGSLIHLDQSMSSFEGKPETLWRSDSMKPVGSDLVAPSTRVRAIAGHPDLVLAIRDGTDYSARILQSSTLKPIHPKPFVSPPGGPFALGPDRKMIARGDGGKIILRDVQSGREVRSWVAHQEPKGQPPYGVESVAQRWNVWRLGAVAIGPNSKWVATGSLDGHVALWRIRDGKRLAQMKVKAGAVTWLRFGPTGRSLYSRHADGTVRQWALPK